ncbi:MAG: segregation and condensation protein A [Fidelibacterota bacterium]
MYRVHLEQFQGPLDLLLYFIRRDEIDIYDIPIARITAEYLETLETMESLNIGVAGEFILMTATLMRIKSRMLLPRPDFDDEGQPIDPRTELVQQLLEYQRFKEAAGHLEQLVEDQSYYFTRTPEMLQDFYGDDPGVYISKVSLFDLARYFKDVLDRRPVINSFDLHPQPISLDDQKVMIFKSFSTNGRVSFKQLVKQCKSKLEIIVTFLAILELVRMCQVQVSQNKLFDDLELRRLELN